MALKLDSRQTRQRSKLDQLSTTTDLRLDAIMNLINDELTMPLRMRANLGSGVDGTPNQNLYVDSIFVKTLDSGAADSGHERSRTIPPISGTLPNYTGGGYIAFPTTSGGSITGTGLTLDKAYTLTLTTGQYVKILVWLNASNQFGMEIGTPAASEAAANLPSPPTDAFALGYIVMNNTGGTISKVLNENIYQFVGGGGSASGGAGEINAVLNASGADGTTGWTAGTSHSITTTTGVTMPLSPAVATAFSMSSSAAVARASQTNSSGDYYEFTMPPGLQNKKLKLEFYAKTPASADGTWAVALYKGATKIILSTDTGAAGSEDTVLLANTTYKFVAYFDADASATYRVNFVQRTRTGANSLYVTNVIVGPGIQPQGAVVGGWVSYTPAFEGLGTVTNASARYRRVGDSMQVAFSVTSGTNTAVLATVSLPSGLTINSTAIPANSIVGDLSASATPFDSSLLYFSGASSKLYFTSGTANYTAGANGTTWANSTGFGGNFFVPIAEWAGSGTVQLAQNDVTYYYSTGNTWGTNNTSAVTAQGPGGVLGGTTTPGAAYFYYTFAPTSPIQVGAKPVLEISNNGTQWSEVGIAFNGANYTSAPSTMIENLRYDGTNYIGAKAALDNAGKIVVTFGKYMSGSTSAWSGTWYWRVKVENPGAAVGFGLYQPGVSAGLVSSSGLAGRADGNVVPSGYVGEQLTVTGAELTTSTTGGVTLTLATLPITSAGLWRVDFYVWNIEAAGVNAGAAFIANAKYNNSTFTPALSTNADNSGAVAFVTQGAAIRGASCGSIAGAVVATDGTKSVTLRQNITISTGTAAARGKIVATRIA